MRQGRRRQTGTGGRALPALLFLLLFAWSLLPQLSSADEATTAAPLSLSAEQRQFLASHPVIRVASDPGWAPIEFADAAGQPTGYSHELLQRLEPLLGVRFEFVATGTWAESEALAASGEVDLLSALGRTAEREARYRFSKPYLAFRSAVVMRADAPAVADFAAVAGKRFALVDGYAETANVLAENPALQVIHVPTVQAALEAVAAGRVDATLGNPAVLDYRIRALGLTMLKIVGYGGSERQDIRFGVRRDWPLLVAALDAAVAAIPEPEQIALRRRWFDLPQDGAAGDDDDEAPKLELSEGERAWLAAHPELSFGVNPWPPVIFEAPAGHAAGLGADIVEKVAKRLGVRVRWQFYPLFSEELEALKAGSLDVIPTLVDVGVPPGIARSRSYLDLTCVIVNRRGAPPASSIEDLAGQTIAVRRGLPEDRQLSARYPAQPLLRLQTQEQVLDAVVDGRAAAAVGTLLAIDYTLSNRGYGGSLKVAGTYAGFEARLTLATRDDGSPLAGILDKGLAALGAEERAAILAHWNATAFEAAGWPERLRRYGWLLALGLLALAVAGFLLLRVRAWARADDVDGVNAGGWRPTIRQLVGLGLVLALLAVGAMALISERQRSVIRELRQREAQRVDSLRLVDQLIASSRDLTRMARLYVATRDSRYRDLHQRIADIRAGRAPLPQNYDNGYWDRVIVRGEAGESQGPPRSLAQRLADQGFSDDELAQFRRALKTSEQLVSVENLAMEQVSSLQAKAAPVPFAAVERAYASLSDPVYSRAVEAIGEAAAEFQRRVDLRTQARVDEAHAAADRLQVAVFALVGFTLLILPLGFWLAEAMAIRPLRNLREAAQRLAAGELAQRAVPAGAREPTQLALHFNRMAESIEAAQHSLRDSEQQARAAEQRLSGIMNTMPGAIYQFLYRGPRDYSFGLVSLGVERLLGVSRSAVEAGGNEMFDVVLAEDRPDLNAAIDGAARAFSEFRHSFRIRHARNGELRWIEARSLPFRSDDGTVIFNGYLADLTERKRLDAELARALEAAEAARRWVLDITDSLPGLVFEFVRHRDGSYVAPFVSSGVLRLTGITREVVVADVHRYFALTLDEDLPAYLAAIERSATDYAEMEHAFRIRHAGSGETRWMVVRAIPVSRDGGEVYWRGYVIDITDQKHLEAQLAAAREAAEAASRRVIDVTDNVPGAVFEWTRKADGSHVASFMSSGIEGLVGVCREEVIARPSRYFDPVLPEDLPAYAAAIEKSAVEGSAVRHTFRIRHVRTGEVRWMFVSGHPPKREHGDANWRGYVMDVTEQKQLEAELAGARELAEAARRRVLEITDNVPGVVYEFLRRAGGGYSFPFANYRIRDLLGATREAVEADANAAFAQVFPEDMPELIATVERSAAELTTWAYQWRVHVPETGGTRWLQGRSTPMRLADGATLWRGVMTDITAEVELRAELARAREVADAASRAKSEFLANMSHEIRTPMNAIIGLSHLTLKTELSARQRDYLAKIHNSAQALLGIINDILDLSKIEAGRLSVETIAFDLHEVLDNLSNLVSIRAQDKGLEFLVSVAREVPTGLFGDPLRLGQILLNLAGNAIKFTASGQVLVKVGLADEAPADDGSRLLRFEVVDTGIGLSEEQQQRLFQAFSQADASTTRKYGGTGLGLAISRQLVTMMGGSIGVHSAPGQGSTFWFTVRLGVSGEASRRLAQNAAALGPRRVLIVDDNATARDTVRGTLEGFGLTVVEAASGAEATRAAQAALHAGAPFDLAILDWQMPGMSGIDTARALRQLDGAPKLILLTAHGRDEVARQAEAEKFDGFLIKPVNPSLLLDAIMQALLGDPGGSSRRVSADQADGTALHGLRLLLAEDNEINQQVASEVLSGFGARVEVAGDGRVALGKVAAGGFDAVLMDMQMPEMDGLEATRAIRALPGCAQLPIIAMTANAMDADRERCLAAGMNAFISKPFQPADLLRTLLHWTRGAADGAAPVRSEQREPPSLARAPVFDRADALARVGSEARLRKLSAQLFARLPSPADEIATLLATGDRAGAVRAAHAVAGSAGLLGYVRLRLAAKALEEALKAGVAHEAQRLDFLRCHDEAAAALATEPAPAVPPPTRFDPALLAALSAQIEACDSQATETIATLAAALGNAAPTALGRVESALERFAFDEAGALLPELAKALDSHFEPVP